MSARVTVAWVGVALLAVGSVHAARLNVGHPRLASQQAGSRGQEPSAALPKAVSPHRALLNQYCIACHNDRARTAGLTLQTIDAEHLGQVEAEVEIWEKVVRKLRARAMPPPGRPQPDDATYDAVASFLETALDRAAAVNPNPGRAPIHRLNRAEYSNAIRDLLALEIDGRALLPPDESGYGFDNIADVLSISPVLLDRYMTAAEKIGRLAIGDPSVRPAVQKYTVPYTLWQDGRMREELPFGSRGGIAIRHHFPLDGEYVIKIVLQRAYGNAIRGLGEPYDLEVRLDRTRINLFRVGGDGARGPWSAVSRPSLYEQTADKGLEVRVSVKAGTRLVGAAFLDKRSVPEGALEPRPGVSSLAFARDRNAPMAVDSIQISGPYNALTPEDSPSRRRVFVCYPGRAALRGAARGVGVPASDALRGVQGSPRVIDDEESCAKEILSTLTRRAYRRPVSDEDLQPLVALYRAGRDKGSFEKGIEFALRGVLIDPEFLFRVERDPVNVAPGEAYRLSDVELASRLSFFLWSSIPGDELLALAERGKLRDPVILQRQVSRMLRDARSSALVSNFFGQWLLLRNMRAVAPDPDAFIDFDENLREALERETELFVESQLREDRSVLDLLGANYTFLNERLARHYGIPNVYGNHFRRVTLTDSRRGGLLSQGSILTVTSYPNRTSPTKRGLWVLEHLLGAPPPPPPPEVPPLPEDVTGAGQSLSMRERMEGHRTNPVCASCHARMDPLGFALENFDGIGTWRTTDGGTSIDASGRLPQGSTLEGPAGLRRFLLGQEERFVETVVEKLLTYALGRGVEYYDAPAVRKITRNAAADDYRWSSVILGIVNSAPFQMRRSVPPQGPAVGQ